jgi:hypothetical protein
MKRHFPKTGEKPVFMFLKRFLGLISSILLKNGVKSLIESGDIRFSNLGPDPLGEGQQLRDLHGHQYPSLTSPFHVSGVFVSGRLELVSGDP